MSVTRAALQQLEEHWAVRAVPAERKARAEEAAQAQLLRSAVGSVVTFDFEDQEGDTDAIRNLATAYELAAIEGLDALLLPYSDSGSMPLSDQSQAAAYKAYELMRALPVPDDTTDRAFHLLHMTGLAYAGDRWDDLRRWLRGRPRFSDIPSVETEPWDRRILYRLYECWLRLIRKQGWDDVNAVANIVSGLRAEQQEHENSLLNGGTVEDVRTAAFRLVGLYHWARATELLATYMLQGQPPGIAGQLDQHYEAAHRAAAASQDPGFDIIIRWLHVASRQMADTAKVNHAITPPAHIIAHGGKNVC